MQESEHPQPQTTGYPVPVLPTGHLLPSPKYEPAHGDDPAPHLQALQETIWQQVRTANHRLAQHPTTPDLCSAHLLKLPHHQVPHQSTYQVQLQLVREFLLPETGRHRGDSIEIQCQ